jgi:hypothetical protein
MGDRGNIVVREGASAVWLYSHWRGSEIGEVVRKALAKKQRWDDTPYLTRIVFQELLNGDTGTSGFGIATSICDNEHPVIVVDTSKQEVQTYGDDGDISGKPIKKTSFTDYIAAKAAKHKEDPGED